MANDKPESNDGASNDRNYRGDGSGKIGVASGAADEAPLAGDMLNFDDDEVMSGRGNDNGGKKRPS